MTSMLLAKKAIYKHDPPPEDPDSLQSYIEKHNAFRACFANEEQFEFFCMLPVGMKDKLRILNRVAEDKRLLDEVLNCEGKDDSSPEHRQMCVACVSKCRPGQAVPYF